MAHVAPDDIVVQDAQVANGVVVSAYDPRFCDVRHGVLSALWSAHRPERNRSPLEHAAIDPGITVRIRFVMCARTAYIGRSCFGLGICCLKIQKPTLPTAAESRQ